MDITYSISLIFDCIALHGYANPHWTLDILGERSDNNTSSRFPFYI